jgi:hypothetical protein
MTDGLIAPLERIREHLNDLATAPLSDEDLAHLVAIEDWLGDLAREAVDA